MKKYFFSSSLILLTCLLSFGQSAEAEKRVLQLAKRKFQWMIERRMDSLEAVLDERLKYIHSNGLTQTRGDVLEDLKSGRLTYQSIEVMELDARLYEATAIVIGKGKFTGVSSKGPFATSLLFTEVYILKNRSWSLASRHANKLP